MPQGRTRTPRNRRGVTGEVGSKDQIMVDWPRSIGFFGALGVAAALDLVPFPIAIFEGDTHFRRIGWDEALDRTAAALRRASPERTFFYGSGRSSS